MKPWIDCTKEEKIERWENARRVVQAIADDPHAKERHWDTGEWGFQTDCGTVGCAAGHCSMDPWFREQGFKSKPHPVSQKLLIEGKGLNLEADFFTDPDGVWTPCWGKITDSFFGWIGSARIFGNPLPRSPEQVVHEIDCHLQGLRY